MDMRHENKRIIQDWNIRLDIKNALDDFFNGLVARLISVSDISGVLAKLAIRSLLDADKIIKVDIEGVRDFDELVDGGEGFARKQTRDLVLPHSNAVCKASLRDEAGVHCFFDSLDNF